MADDPQPVFPSIVFLEDVYFCDDCDDPLGVYGVETVEQPGDPITLRPMKMIVHEEEERAWWSSLNAPAICGCLREDGPCPGHTTALLRPYAEDPDSMPPSAHTTNDMRVVEAPSALLDTVSDLCCECYRDRQDDGEDLSAFINLYNQLAVHEIDVGGETVFVSALSFLAHMEDVDSDGEYEAGVNVRGGRVRRT